MISFEQASKAVKKHGGVVAAARALGVSRHSVSRSLHGKNSTDPAPPTDPDELRMYRLGAENKRLRSELSKLSALRAEDAEFANLASRLMRERTTAPDWTIRAPRRGKRSPAIASVAVSDIHHGERINPSEIGGVNDFNAEISLRRIQATFENTARLARDYTSGIDYQGVYLHLLGDTVSGEIHEELTETNDRTLPEAILEVSQALARGTKLLAEEFGKVRVVGVPGNHGRMTRKPHFKRRSHRNIDWLVYHLVAKEFTGDKRVSFAISDAPDAFFSIYGTRYAITHGDQFRGGTGIAGAMSPLLLGDHRKRKRALAMGQPYDVLVLGHWHQLILGVSGMIVNGSIKGYDEFAYGCNFGFEPPQQAFWITDPDHGITLRAPVRCE